LGLKPGPALASEPIVRSWGVRNCTQYLCRKAVITGVSAAHCFVDIN
jgi:hypothetical protein